MLEDQTLEPKYIDNTYILRKNVMYECICTQLILLVVYNFIVKVCVCILSVYIRKEDTVFLVIADKIIAMKVFICSTPCIALIDSSHLHTYSKTNSKESFMVKLILSHA